MLRSRASANASQRNVESSSPIPLGTSDTVFTTKSSKRSKKNNILRVVQLSIILGVGVYAGKAFMDSQRLNEQLTRKLERSEEECHSKVNEAHLVQAKIEERLNRELQSNEKEMKEKLDKVTKDYARAQKENERLLREKGKNPAETKLKNQIDSLRRASLRIQQQLQKFDKQAVLDKFGEGPYFVEIALDFPPDSPMSDLPSPPTKFVIELAPLDLMPHSVHLFLEMVSHKLWDGCSFMRNAGHVIQASSAPYYKNQGTRQKLTEAFASSGFESVAFQEYHEDYPHVKYTVGFAGRPGGPDFYVSVLDNTRNHGPGGQGNYADPQEADPCFGKVVEGFDAVDRMHKMPKEPGDYEAMVRNVGIEYARILDRRAK